MALISCEECKGQVSDKAATCPHCGAPVVLRETTSETPVTIGPSVSGTPQSTNLTQSPSKSSNGWKWLFLIVMAVAAFYYFQRPEVRNQNKAELPMEFKYRRAMTGPGYVAVFENRSDRYLALKVTLRNPSLNQEKDFRVDVPPNGTTEFGYREGWQFASGDEIAIFNEEYRPYKGRIP